MWLVTTTLTCSVTSVVSDSLWPYELYVAHQDSLPMGFSRQEYWDGCHSLLEGIFPAQGWKPSLLLAGRFLTTSTTWEAREHAPSSKGGRAHSSYWLSHWGQFLRTRADSHFVVVLVILSTSMQVAGSSFPDQGSNQCPWHWKNGVLTTGQPGNSPDFHFGSTIPPVFFYLWLLTFRTYWVSPLCQTLF